MKDELREKKDLLAEVIELRRRLKLLEAGEQEQESLRAKLIFEHGPFRSVFECATIGMTVVEPNGTGQLVAGNPALQNLLGYSDRELRRMSFADFTHPDDIKPNLDLYREVLEDKRDSYRMEKRYVRKDGRIVHVELTGTVVRDSSRAPQFLVGMVQDVTEVKRLRHQIEDYEDLRILSGLLSVCSSCHQIRNDGGEWTTMSDYLKRHSEAIVSDTICPTCFARLNLPNDENR